LPHPGLTIDTSVGTFTPLNLASIAPLIEQGVRSSEYLVEPFSI
jgi:hypothetical protein